MAQDIADDTKVVGEFGAIVTRSDGSVERRRVRNIVTAAGLNHIANRAVNSTSSTPVYVLGVGTVTAAASLGSTNFGEVSRKASINTGASAQSREWIFLTATWAGNVDGLTGVTLDSAALLCSPTSGVAPVINIANGLGVTLAASDFLMLTGRIRVGSHDTSHST